MGKRNILSIISVFFVVLSLLIATGPLFIPLLIPYFPPKSCDVELSDFEIRNIVIDEIKTSGLRFFFPKNAADLKAEDGFWEIKRHETPANPESEYDTNKYEANFAHPHQFVSAFIGTCGKINMIFNKPFAGYKYGKL